MEDCKLGGYTFLAVMVIWAASGLVEYRRNQIIADIEDADRTALPWRELTAPVHAGYADGDVFMYLGGYDIRHAHYTEGIANRPIIPPEYTESDIRLALAGAPRLWVGVHQSEFQQANLNRFREVILQEGYLFCETYFDHTQVELNLFARSFALCPGLAITATFGDQVALSQVEVVRDGTSLTVYTGWSRRPTYQPDVYSVALHLTRDLNQPPVRQQDVGLNADLPAYVPVRMAFDTAELPAGTYQLIATVYDWRTGQRLPAVDDAGSTSEVWPIATLTLP
jgi:hypothetical protein